MDVTNLTHLKMADDLLTDVLPQPPNPSPEVFRVEHRAKTTSTQTVNRNTNTKIKEVTYHSASCNFNANGWIFLIFSELSQINLDRDVFLISFNCSANISNQYMIFHEQQERVYDVLWKSFHKGLTKRSLYQICIQICINF